MEVKFKEEEVNEISLHIIDYINKIALLLFDNKFSGNNYFGIIIINSFYKELYNNNLYFYDYNNFSRLEINNLNYSCQEYISNKYNPYGFLKINSQNHVEAFIGTFHKEFYDQVIKFMKNWHEKYYKKSNIIDLDFIENEFDFN